MTEVNPVLLQNAGTTETAEILRGALTSSLAGPRTSGSLVARGGVVPQLGTMLAVTQNGTPNMSVNVGSGVVYVPGTEGATQACYHCLNDATKNLVVSAADGANPRIDLVVAKVQDTQYSGATNAWSLAVVTGTPAGVPAVPTAPNNSLTLAQLAVGAGVTSVVTANITDKRIWAAALGGVIMCTSAARPTNIMTGQLIWETDTQTFKGWDGTTWNSVSQYRPASQILGGTTASVTFNSIPTTLKKLTLNWVARGDTASVATAVNIRINGDTGANYFGNLIQLSNTSVGGFVNPAGNDRIQIGTMLAASAGANQFTSGVAEFIGWDRPHTGDKLNTIFRSYGYDTAPTSYFIQGGGLYNTTGPFNSITIFPTAGNFVAGSEFTLVGE